MCSACHLTELLFFSNSVIFWNRFPFYFICKCRFAELVKNKHLAHRASILTFRCILSAQDSFGRPLWRPTGCPVHRAGRSRKLAVMNGQWRPMGRKRGHLPPQWKGSDVPARPDLARGARQDGQALPDACGPGVLERSRYDSPHWICKRIN